MPTNCETGVFINTPMNTLPIDYLCAKVKRIAYLEKEYKEVIANNPFGSKALLKYAIASELSGIVPKRLVEPPLKREEPYPASPNTRIIAYPRTTIWRTLATIHYYEIAGLRKFICGNEDFQGMLWSNDFKETFTYREGQDMVEQILSGKVKGKTIKAKRGRPSKAISRFNAAMKEKALIEQGTIAKKVRRKSYSKKNK